MVARPWDVSSCGPVSWLLCLCVLPMAIAFHSLTLHVQEKSAQDTHSAWQRGQQRLSAGNPEAAGMALEEFVDGISTGTVQNGLRQESESTRRGEMPVFRLPGVRIRLPTAAGTVSFSPLFLSKEQLDRTWVSTSLASSDGL